MDIILLAVPLFFLLIAIELIAERVRGTSYYRLNDAITSLTLGTVSQLTKVVKLLVPFTIYVLVFQNYALFELPDTWLVWIVAFVAYDFCYYWLHRMGHEMNLLWAAHVVHHSSEEYNLTTALRQTGTSFLSFVFYIPLALLGFEPLMIATVGGLNLIYQYWVHTQHIGKMGWYEWIFVTPSNHRGHHAQNAVYIDRNYGGVFILWDRMFGSYQEELDDDPPIYGIRGALASWNPLWANVAVYYQLWQDALHTRNWWHKLTLWFRRTGWRPPDVEARYPLYKTDLDNFHKFDTPLSRRDKLYAFLQYLFNVGISLSVLINLDVLVPWQELSLIALVLFSTFSNGAMLEGRSFAPRMETCKHVLVLLVSIVVVGPANAWVLLAASVSLTSLLLLALWYRGGRTETESAITS